MSQPRTSKRSENKHECGFKDGGKTLKSKTRRKTKEMRVLAERNPAVVAVGAWVETAEENQEHPAVRALITEELQEETRREKEESLRQFQDAVRRRVLQQARIRKQQQLQKSYETAEKECRVVQQTSDSAQRLTPQKSLFQSWPQRELAICSPSAHRLMDQEHNGLRPDAANQHSHQLSKVMKQVRLRLASRQTLRDDEHSSELPGGIWKASSVRDPESHAGRALSGDEEEQESDKELREEDEIPLAGQHDRPVSVQSHSRKTVTFEKDAVSARLKETNPTNPNPQFRSTQVLWPKDDQEEMKRQRQSQFLMYRRLFMDIEREQVKEQLQHKKHLRRIARIKSEKEQQREKEERRMEFIWRQEESRRELAERERLVLERLQLEEEELEEDKRRARAKKVKETTRYIEALRAQMKERLEQDKVELPPLCSCGESFWDSHPDTCANNCVFYNNPKGYAQALHSVLLNCELNEGSAGYTRGFTRKIIHTLSHQN